MPRCRPKSLSRLITGFVVLCCAGLADARNLLCNGDFEGGLQDRCWVAQMGFWSEEDSAGLASSGSLVLDVDGDSARQCVALPDTRGDVIYVEYFYQGATGDEAQGQPEASCQAGVSFHEQAGCSDTQFGSTPLDIAAPSDWKGWRGRISNVHQQFTHVQFEFKNQSVFLKPIPPNIPARCMLDRVFIAAENIIFRAGFGSTTAEP